MTINAVLRNTSISLMAMAFVTTAYAAATDISTVPLNTYSAPSSTDVKPNIMFILDNSGSMAWQHMPDNSADAGSSVPFTYGYYGYRSSQCNGVYYNPAIVYKLPVKADGSYYSDASFTAALPDGFKAAGASNTAVDLSASFQSETDSSGQAAYYFSYSGTQTTEKLKNYYDSTSTFSKECSSANNTAPGNAVFAKVVVSATSGPNSTDERQNFANWYSYYRTRMLMMKSASGLAFKNIDNRFRVGFMTINNVSGTADFRNIGEFTGTTKDEWYASLYASEPSGSTPLRSALADAGRMYAGKLTSRNGVTVTDPLQYSCQQNYTILSTDGFWNTGSGYQMDGSTAVGNQDGALARPYNDGASGQLQSRTKTLQSQTITSQPQASTSTLQTRTTSNVSAPSIQQRTSSNGGSTWTAWTNVGSCTVDNSGNNQTGCNFPVTTSSDSGVTWTAWAYQSSACTADTTSSSRRQCSGSVPIKSAWSNVASCTVSAGRECQYTAWTTPVTTASCTPLAQSVSSPYTVGTATQCTTLDTLGTWVSAASCTVSGTQNCRYTAWSSWGNVLECTGVAESVAPNYTVVTPVGCQTLTSGGIADTLADVAAYYYNTDLRSDVAANGTGTCTGPTIPPRTTPNNLCPDNVPANGRDTAVAQHMTTFTVGLGVRGKMVYSPTYLTDKTGDFVSVSKVTTTDASTGTCSWQTSGTCNWPAPGMANSSDGKIENVDDLWHAAVNGHGTYFSATTPDLLASGLTSALATIINTPRPGTAAAAASSNPNVSASDNFVFSSSYKSVEWYGELIRQQIDTDGVLSAQNWSAMRLLDCATTEWTASTPYVAGSAYRQGTRCYRVKTAYTSGATFSVAGIDGTNTAVVNVDEAATTKVPVVPQTSRTIYTKGTTGLIPFLWSSLDATQKAYFTAPTITYASTTAGLSQFCSPAGGTSAQSVACLSATLQANNTVAAAGAAGEALINFLRGDRSNEGGVADNTKYFRQRTHVLGDIVSSEARYVQRPLFNYSDAHYVEYATLKAARRGQVYVGANDGMLHAFDAGSGQETWAYIPSIVLPNLYKLADKKYSEQTQHQYFVDNSPETGDICPNANAATPTTCTSAQWKTILVGGLNRGGKGYYALDITDPDAPTLLWEFTDANLGYTYGNPSITKLANGKWVVLVSSGYNNTDGSAATKGQGRLYVLDAVTGLPITQINTGVGDATSPSGLARVTAHVVDALTNNTAKAAYGGDTFGNLWRFDINGDIGAAGYDAQLLVSVKDAAGVGQPITVKPVKATIQGKPIVFVGTGRYLGTTDVSDASTQSIYAIKDTLASGTTASVALYGNPRTVSNNFVRQTFTDTTCPSTAPTSVCIPSQVVRTTSNNAMDWATKNGWYIDFVTGGERPSGDLSLALGALLFTTITPQAANVNACGTETGTAASFFCSLDYSTGAAIPGTSGVGCASLGSGLVTRPVVISLPDGSVQVLIRGTGAPNDDPPSDGTGVGTGTSGTDNANTTVKEVILPPPPAGATRRVSWRTLGSQ